MSSQSFSESIDNALDYLRPHGRKHTSYPAIPDTAELRQGANESLREWLIRLVRSFCDNDPSRCAIEDNIGVFVSLHWQRAVLSGANIHAFVMNCLLEDFFNNNDNRWDIFYLRLDLDRQSLGQPFSHPLPHIHVAGNLSPRLSLSGGISGNIVMDFFEFLYRQYAPGKWNDWVRREWNNHFDFIHSPEEENPLDRIFQAFADNELSYLRQNGDQLTRLRLMLQKRKDELFGFFMDTSDRALLAYP
jgi:hypothetical protein